jgi:hypothetical protein
MTRFVVVELDASRYDLFIYTGHSEVEIRGIPYYEVKGRINMRIQANDSIAWLPLCGIPYARTGAEYMRMRDAS